jgi:hypothetical protein
MYPVFSDVPGQSKKKSPFLTHFSAKNTLKHCFRAQKYHFRAQKPHFSYQKHQKNYHLPRFQRCSRPRFGRRRVLIQQKISQQRLVIRIVNAKARRHLGSQNFGKGN